MKSTLIHVWDNYKCLCVLESEIKCILFPEAVQAGSETNSLKRIHPLQESTDCICNTEAFSSWYSSSVPLALPQKKVPQATDRNSKHPYIGWAPNILSVSICLQFFLLSLPPSLPPSCSAPIGSRSCSTGRLLAPSHQKLAEAARICPHTNRSLAFCLWMDGTESEGSGQGERTEKTWSSGSSSVCKPSWICSIMGNKPLYSMK